MTTATATNTITCAKCGKVYDPACPHLNCKERQWWRSMVDAVLVKHYSDYPASLATELVDLLESECAVREEYAFEQGQVTKD